MFFRFVWLTLTISIMFDLSSHKALARADSDVDLNRRVVSLLQRECLACHGPEKQEGNLRLDSLESLRSGGDSGPAIEAATGENEKSLAQESLLYSRLKHPDATLRMPPKRPLNESDIAMVKDWIASGAKWPTDAPVGIESELGPEMRDAWSDSRNPIRVLFEGKRLDLWSLKSVVRPSIPDVDETNWCRNAIDRFVLAGWESQGLRPSPNISDQALVRRTSLDVTGLPPNYDEVQSFEQENSSENYARWIDSLIESPAFGVHWARSWLDVVRYSDSNGFDWDELRPNAWRYRDYVVRSLNSDLAFDRFMEQQLAGDEMFQGPPKNAFEQDCLIATGYLRMGPQDNAAGLFNEQDRARSELLSDLTETTASAMLGLTMSCCRCHDHKTDPLSHRDHYRLRAFFAASYAAEKVAIENEEEQNEIASHNEKLDGEIDRIKNSISKIEENVLSRHPEKIKRNKVKEFMAPDEREQVDTYQAEIEELSKSRRSPTYGLLIQDKSDKIQDTYVLSGGDYRSPKEAVEFGFPSVLFPNTPSLVSPVNTSTTGRRLTLARWMASRQNPWTSRVIVNRIWQGYFGRGLVETPNDFGVTGATPSYPELLDYLANELMENGWSLKHIHRLILTSNTYRQQPIAGGQEVASLRVQLRRMSAEQLRDSILKVSGLLQERAGGPPVWPELDEQTLAANPAVLDDNETKTKGWYPSPQSDQTVRSLYLIQKRTIRLPWLETFDLPENVVSCGRRECSIVSPQSLTLMNGSLTLQASIKISESIRVEFGDEPETQIVQAYRQILQRDPSDEERTSCLSFLATRSLLEFCSVLLNTNEFMFAE